MMAKRLPCRDDRLISEVDSWNNAMTFSDDPAERHVLMWRGYFLGARLLVDHCGEKPHEGHTLIYPIWFSYRQALEMAMKWIVSSYGHDFGVSEPKPDHNLWRLWQSCKAIITTTDDEIAAAIEKLLKDFHDLDATAEAFRYPLKKDGTLLVLPSIAFNLTKLRQVMEGLENYFSEAERYLANLCSAGD
jgi:hypothetical protein